MSRRTFEGPMDWEYQNQGPVDLSSPFAQFSQGTHKSSFESPSKYGRQGPNPFASAGSPSKQQSQEPHPPHTSFFNPQLQKQYSAPQFRNPAFTTPQKRVEELAQSEYSGAESSPAMTDASEMPLDTPEVDRSEDIGRHTVTPATANRTLFPKSASRSHAPGKGELPRGKLDLAHRDRVRKRKRQYGDKDVGSVRPRLPHDSDESDSDWDEDFQSGSRAERRAGRGRGGPAQPGWFSRFLTAVTTDNNLPSQISRWLQLSVNLSIFAAFVWVLWSAVTTMRSDLLHATDKERAKLLHEISLCSLEYTKNRCSPKEERLPALNEICNNWENCMNQDENAVMRIQVSVRNVAEIINEFSSAINWQAWVFLLSAVLVCIVASNIGFGRLAYTRFPEQTSMPQAQAQPSHPAALPFLSPSKHDPNHAYIIAPISHTPRHIRRQFMMDEATDTDNSPDLKTIMAPPQTPSGRRSPSKEERGRSPTKSGRSPAKRY